MSSRVSTPSKRPARWLLVVIALSGAALLAHGLYIPAKAQLAQVLLDQAWQQAKREGGRPKPWPWADTWPVARLSAQLMGRDRVSTRPASYQVDQSINQIVLANASGRNLAFGPAHVPPSSSPGENGHIVISGHRDTHFDWLAELSPGDVITLEDRIGSQQFQVIGHEIIDLTKQSFALLPDQSLLSLVTCYPFGALAPNTSQRYIVHAEPVDRLAWLDSGGQN